MRTKLVPLIAELSEAVHDLQFMARSPEREKARRRLIEAKTLVQEARAELQRADEIDHKLREEGHDGS
jgi:hypothetical protein